MLQIRPLIVVNFKCYKFGKEEIKLAKACKSIGNKVDVIVVPQFTDLKRISKLRIRMFAQHVDAVEKATSTGHIHPNAVIEAGAEGTLLNHAEHRLKMDVLKKSVKICKKLGLRTIICSPSVGATKALIKLNPDYITFEDPTLISTGRSISQVKPDDVRRFVKLFKGSKVVPLCGAGVSNGEDFRKALELGTKGVLVASAIAKAGNPRKVLRDFVNRI